MSSQSRDISESRPLIAVLLIASMLTIMLAINRTAISGRDSEISLLWELIYRPSF